MKRSVKNVRLNSEFKRVQRLPFLVQEREFRMSGDVVPFAAPVAADCGKGLEGRRSAEVHAIKCTHTC
jgi:hypothetical protein